MMDWGLVISLLALAGTIYTYLAHNHRLREQEKKLNEYQIKKNEAEEVADKKAIVRGNLVHLDRGSYVLKIYNSGRNIAKNVDISFSDGADVLVLTNPFPFEFLNPQDHTDIRLVHNKQSVDKFKIVITWEDGASASNKFEQILTF